jgi:hypothetical protein
VYPQTRSTCQQLPAGYCCTSPCTSTTSLSHRHSEAMADSLLRVAKCLSLAFVVLIASPTKSSSHPGTRRRKPSSPSCCKMTLLGEYIAPWHGSVSLSLSHTARCITGSDSRKEPPFSHQNRKIRPPCGSDERFVFIFLMCLSVLCVCVCLHCRAK